MKKITSLMFLFFLFLSYSFTQSMDVSGAGTSAVNGTYSVDGSCDGVNAYSMGSINIYRFSNNWIIGTDFCTNSLVNAYYFGFSSSSTPDGVSFSRVNGADPAPTVSSAVPVELTTFTAILREREIELNWETATEINNYGFELQRSESWDADDNNWESIGFILGHGNSNSPKSYSFTDECEATSKIYYRLKQIDFDGAFEYSNVLEVSVTHLLPTQFTLNQNYPNPFNPMTVISYQLSVDSPTKLEIFDSIGGLVAKLVDEKQSAGSYSYNFNAFELSSGIYIYKLTSGNLIQSKKMLLLQ